MNIESKFTLAALFGILDESEQLYIIHRLGPHEAEAVAEGTVEILRETSCVEVCGDNIVLRVVSDVETWPDTPTPVLVITIGEKEART